MRRTRRNHPESFPGKLSSPGTLWRTGPCDGYELVKLVSQLKEQGCDREGSAGNRAVHRQSAEMDKRHKNHTHRQETGNTQKNQSHVKDEKDATDSKNNPNERVSAGTEDAAKSGMVLTIVVLLV
jgi:hypothetical protein